LIPRCKKSGREGKRLAWLSQDLLVKLKGKKEMHRQWKQGQVSWEGCRAAARLCREGVRKAKAHTELNLARDSKNSKKGSYRYVSQKRKVREHTPYDDQDRQTGMRRRLRYSMTFLPRSSLATSLSTPLKWIDLKIRSREAKCLPL